MYGKTINSGQICISPNYVMCTEKTKTALLKELKDTFKEWYDSNPKESACYSGKMIHNRHFDRLVDMIKNTQGKIEIGGASEPENRYIEPTVISGMMINSYFLKRKMTFLKKIFATRPLNRANSRPLRIFQTSRVNGRDLSVLFF